MEISKLILEFLNVLIWPVVVLIGIFKFQGPLGLLIDRIKKAEFPGGISIETFPEQIKEAKKLSEEVKQEEEIRQHDKAKVMIPLTDANARMMKMGLDPSPSGLEISKYRDLAEQDPNLCLAGLRMEVELMLKNLAKGFKVKISDRESASMVVRRLKANGSITNTQEELILIVLKLCNAAIHGLKVSVDQAQEILGIVQGLRDDYVSWLSWGFPGE